MFRFLTIFVLFLNCLSISFPQVNTEKFRKEYEAKGIFGNFSLAAGLASGNSEYLKVKGASRIDYVEKGFDFFIIGNYEFQEANEERVVNKGFVHLRNIIKLSLKFYLEFFLQKEFNEFILLEDRNLAGGGLRTDLIKLFNEKGHPNLEIFLGTGMMFENEEYNINSASETNLIRSTNYFTINWKIVNRVSFLGINYFQFDIERIRDYRVVSSTGLNFLITDNFIFNTSILYRFDNEPVENVKNYDLELTNGITFSF